jgi:DNA-binding transcriptional ArsR family regulator
MIENLEQLRALSEGLRMRVLEALLCESYTITQLGSMLGEAPAKILYHVRELERVGLVKLVEKREKGGSLEKYYRAVAEVIQISRTLLRSVPLDDSLALMQEWLNAIMRESMAALERSRQAPEETLRLSSDVLRLAPNEAAAFSERLQALLAEYTHPEGEEGLQEWRFHSFFYRAPSATESSAPLAAPETKEHKGG